MFFSRKKATISYDPAVQRPALRCSICTGEQVAGFIHADGHFEEVQLIRRSWKAFVPGTASRRTASLKKSTE